MLNRRDFVKVIGAGAGVISLSRLATTDKTLAASSALALANNEKAMLYDASKCIGCRACQTACRRWNELPPEPNGYGGLYDNPSRLSARTWTLVKAKAIKAGGGDELLLCKYQCMHCTDAACVRVCPTKALTHSELGFVAYDPDLCSGCGYCEEFCPFYIPRLGGSTLTGIQRMQKCTFCANRVTNNRPTACADACPTGALTFGNRKDLIEEGLKRTSELKKSYSNAVFYGDKELGGLHVMYVLKEEPTVYALPLKPNVPPATVVWKNVIQPLGWVVGGLTIAGLGLNYLVARKAKIAREQSGKREE